MKQSGKGEGQEMKTGVPREKDHLASLKSIRRTFPFDKESLQDSLNQKCNKL